MIYGDIFAAFWGKRELWMQAVSVEALRSSGVYSVVSGESVCVRERGCIYSVRYIRLQSALVSPPSQLGLNQGFKMSLKASAK